MKKKSIVFILLGLLGISLGVQSVTQAEDVEQVTEPVVEEVVDESIDGEASDSLEMGRPKRSLVQSNETRTIELQKFYIETTDGGAGSIPVPLTNTKYRIHYNKNNKATFLHEGVTNEKGEIVNLTLKDVPLEDTSLKIRYYLGNDQRGYVQKYDKNSYSYVFTLTLNSENVVNYSSKAMFGANGNQDSFFYNYQASRINYYFDQAVNEYSKSVNQANQLFPESTGFEIKPINISFEKGRYLDEGNAFSKNGHDGSKIPEIVMGDWSNKRVFTENYYKHNIMHEWTHWNMSSAFTTASGGYANHYSYNANPGVSYREGFALFTGEMFAKNYDLHAEDTKVQTDKNNGINRLFGKSTNITVQQVLYDLLDTGTNDESFSISQRYLDEELSDQEIRRLNLGILHTAMVESKSTTLQGLLNYLESKYVLTASDKAKFAHLLEINGLARDGSFTLDGEGNPLTAPMMAPAVLEEEDGFEINDF